MSLKLVGFLVGETQRNFSKDSRECEIAIPASCRLSVWRGSNPQTASGRNGGGHFSMGPTILMAPTVWIYGYTSALLTLFLLQILNYSL